MEKGGNLWIGRDLEGTQRFAAAVKEKDLSKYISREKGVKS